MYRCVYVHTCMYMYIYRAKWGSAARGAKWDIAVILRYKRITSPMM